MGDQLGSPDDEGLSFSCLDICSVRFRIAPLDISLMHRILYVHPETARRTPMHRCLLSGRTPAARGRTKAASGLAGNYRPRNAS